MPQATSALPSRMQPYRSQRPFSDWGSKAFKLHQGHMQNLLYGPLPPSEQLQKEYGVAAWREFMFHQVCDVLQCCSDYFAQEFSHRDLLFFGERAGCEAEIFRQASTLAEYLDPQTVEDAVERTFRMYGPKFFEMWEKQGRPWKKGAWVQKQLQDRHQHAIATAEEEAVQ